MKTHKFLLALLGTLIVGTGSAQTWTLDGANQSTSLIASSTESAVAIDPVSGVVALRTGGSPPPQPTVTVTAPGSVGLSQNFNVSWSTSGFTGTVTCTASATTAMPGWSGTISGSPVQVTSPSTTQTVTLSLQCTGSNGTQTGTAVVNITNSACRPPGYTRDSTSAFVSYQLNTTPYSTLMGVAFPGFNAFNLGNLGPGQVLAAEFIAPATTATDGYYEITSLASGPGTPISSLSTCPGDIDYRLNTQSGGQRICMRVGNESGPQWTVNQSQSLSVIRCVLTPGTRYYFNIAFETCDGGVCNFRVASRDVTARGDDEAISEEQGQGQ